MADNEATWGEDKSEWWKREQESKPSWFRAEIKGGDKTLIVRALNEKEAAQKVAKRLMEGKQPEAAFILVPLPDDEMEVLE